MENGDFRAYKDAIDNAISQGNWSYTCAVVRCLTTRLYDEVEYDIQESGCDNKVASKILTSSGGDFTRCSVSFLAHYAQTHNIPMHNLNQELQASAERYMRSNPLEGLDMIVREIRILAPQLN